MKNVSIWKDNIDKKEFSKLTEDKEVDVLIIGGGITGINTLYHLRNSNLKVILVEQNKIGYSVTGSSTGKLTYLQNDLIDKIKTSFDKNVAIKYINSQKEAINLAVNIINSNNVDCDLTKTPSYIYTNKDSEVEKMIKLEKFLNSCGIKTYKDSNKLVESKYMFKVEDTYMFHPIKYLHGLIKEDDEIYEETSIKKIEKKEDYYICYTDNNKIKAKYVVIASHYPYFNMPYLFVVKASLEKSYISASPYKTDNISLISYSKPFISIRNYKDYLLYLSNSHGNYKETNDLKNFKELDKKIKDLGLKEKYLWSNIDIITNDNLPYIGEIKENLYIGTGYNTWGMTNGILAGRIISDLIKGQKPEYWDLFDPNRKKLLKTIKVFSNIKDSMIGYVNGFTAKSNFLKYEGSAVEYNGKKVYKKCPHMGCNLVFNEVEKTYDCPCHGSRFDEKGKCISGPANEDITCNQKKQNNSKQL